MWLLSSGNSTTSPHRLCEVLQLIHFNEAKQQYQTQPMDRCGPVFLILDNPLQVEHNRLTEILLESIIVLYINMK